MSSARFTYPFRYVPSPEIRHAAHSLIERIGSDESLRPLFAEGKMMGVLQTDAGFLYAFSGLAGGRAVIDGFVPPIYDYTDPEGYFRKTEARISAMTDGEQKSRMSAELQDWLFHRYRVSNARGESLDIAEIFSRRGLVPPAGTGDCAAPRLLQYAYSKGMKPLAMGEFWYGESRGGKVREHGRFYPACTGKCGPLLNFMLEGLDVELARNGKRGFPAKEVLVGILGIGHDREDLAGPFGVVGRDLGGMHVNESAVLEVAMDVHREDRADPIESLEGIGPRTEVSQVAEELERGPLLLKGIILVDVADEVDLARVDFERLLGLGSEAQLAGDLDGRGRLQMLIAGSLGVDNLDAFENRSVMKLDETDFPVVAVGPNPPVDNALFFRQFVRALGIELVKIPDRQFLRHGTTPCSCFDILEHGQTFAIEEREEKIFSKDPFFFAKD